MLQNSIRTAARRFTGHSLHLRRSISAGLLWCITLYGIAPVIINAQTAVNGNIAPNKIEIDQSANLTPNGPGTVLNGSSPGTAVDWQKNALTNNDPPSLIGGIATGINSGSPNTTGAVGGVGHWYGARIVDGVDGAEKDIFLQGGKVNEPASWVIGPGSVGSSKYDASETYMANNQTSIFFGMERAGNNGTTAFDFEFNQLAPDLADPRNRPTTYVPKRSAGDKLISFEMQGSGGASGSVAYYIFNYDGTNFVPLCDSAGGTTCPAGIYTSINGGLDTPAGAWGFVNSQRNWVLGNFERRLFAEAQVPLSLLPGVNSCGGSLFVQVRTRASAALGSDAKDTTPIFQYIFGGPNASGALSANCGLDIAYDASASLNSNGGNTNLTYSWTFQKNNGGTWTNVGTSTAVSGVFTAPSPGTYRGLLVITEGGNCTDDVMTNEVTVNNSVGGAATLTADCDDTFAYSASGTGGSGSYNFSWTIYKENGATDLVAKTFSSGPGTSSSGTLDIDDFNTVAKGEGNYYAVVQISDSNNSTCVFSATSNAIDVRYALTASASKSGAVAPAAGFTDTGFVATMTGSTNALAGDTVTTEWQYLTGGVWTPSGDLDLTYTRTLADIFSLGVSDTATTSILTDSYNLKRGTLQVRLHAVRTLNGNSCSADSAPVLVKAIKAIDP